MKDWNIFLEGSPRRFIVKVMLPVDVMSFSELARVSETLRFIDTVLRKEVPEVLPRRQRRYARARIINFNVSSPPEFTILAFAPWIAIFIMLIANYDKFKNNIPDIASDIGRIVSRVKGLSQTEREHLRMAAISFLERFYSQGETASRGIERRAGNIAERFGRRRRELIGRGPDEVPQIEIIDIDIDDDETIH